MLKWFNNLKIGVKLFAILLIPLAGLFYFLIGGIAERVAIAADARRLETLMNLSTRIGATVHELQKERGMSALLLSTRGASGAAELQAQRRISDEKIAELEAALQSIEISAYGSAFQTNVDEALTQLEALPDLRRQVDGFLLTDVEGRANYTEIIASLLAVSTQVITVSESSGEVARNASAYLALLQAKERAGRERALLSAAFGSGQFTLDQFQEFLANSAEQETYLDLFLSYASDQQRAFSQSTVVGQSVDEVASMKQAAQEAGPETSLNQDAARWFEVATDRIDLLNEVEDRLASDLLNAVGDIRQSAERTLWFFATLAAVTLALGVGSGFFARSIARPLQAMTGTAQQIAAGDLEQHIAVDTRDEIGALASAFNHMAAQLRDLIGTLEQRVAERTKALATVAEVGTTTSTILETERLLQEVVDLTKERFGFYHAHIYLLDEAGDTLVLAAGAGEVGRQMVAEGRSIPLSREQSLVARAARERQGVTVNDVSQAADFLPHPLLPETRSEMAVPMIVGDKVIGVLDVQADEVDRFTEADVHVQSTLTAQIAVAVQNARQYEQTQKRAAELATVAEVSTAASTVLDPDQLLQSAVDLVKERFDLYHTHVYLLDEAGETLVVAAGAGEVGRQMVAEGRSIPLSREQSLVARAARERQGVTVNDVSRAADFLPHPLLPETRSEMAVPMIVSDKVIGVLDVQADEVDRFTEADVHVQTTLAAQIAVAVQNARTYTQAQRQAERESMLNEISRRIQSATTVEAALQIAARELGRALGAPLTIAQVGLRDSDNNGRNNRQ